VTIVNLISSTRTGKGLVIRAELDRSEYETGTTVTKEQMEQLAIEQCEFHGEWNYSIHSQSD
jgi:desulfoferrodoxin (superoxide reductase-like protein)